MKTVNNTAAVINNETKTVIKAKKSGTNYVHFYTEHGRFYTSLGNSKVDVPIISAGSGTNCVNAEICPFHTTNYKKSGYPECYACVTERVYPNTLESRDRNEEILKAFHADGKGFQFGQEVGIRLAKECKKMKVKYLRINESSDLAEHNVEFFKGVSLQLLAEGITAYAYSKSSTKLIEDMRSAGVTVQVSEDDFICVKDEAEAKEMNLPVCPGVGCGKSCLLCPMNIKTAVVGH
jgi:hypothetical protein